MIKIKLGAIEFVLKLKDDFTKTIRKARLESKKTTKEMSSGFKKAGEFVKKFRLKILAVVAALFVMVKVIKATITAFKAQEQAVARLSAALENQGFFTEENVKSLTDQAAALQKVTQFGDEQIISGQAMLASFALNTEQIKKMTPAMLDLAIMTQKTTGAQSDLESIAKLVGIALGGQAGRLVQMGIKLSEAEKKELTLASATEKINVLFKIFQKNAGGLAVAVGETATGAIDKLKNKIGDFLEKEGKGWAEFIDKSVKHLGILEGSFGITEHEMKLLSTEFAKTTKNADDMTLSLDNVITTDLIDAFVRFRESGDDVGMALSKARIEIQRTGNPLKFYGDLVKEISDKRLTRLKKELKGVGIELKDNDAKSLQVIAQYSEMEKRFDDSSNALESARGLWEQLNEVQGKGAGKITDVTNAFDIQNSKVNDLKKQIQDYTTFIMLNGDESGKLKTTLDLLNADYTEQKQLLDGVSLSLSQTTNATKNYVDAFAQAFGSEGAAALIKDTGAIIEEEFRAAQERNGATKEEIDDMIKKFEDQGTTILRTKDDSEDLNQALGKDFTAAVKGSSKDREILTTEINTLSDSMETLLDFTTSVKSELDRINSTSLNDKEANWTINMQFVNSSVSSDEE